MKPIDLFLSHSSADAAAARELRTDLEAAGYSVWMAPDDVTGTDPWPEQILAAIHGGRAMLVLISANANRSSHVPREVGLAIGRNRPVLPIRIEAVAPEGALEYHLAGIQHLDAFPPPLANHRDRIVRRLSAILPLEPTERVALSDAEVPPSQSPVSEDLAPASPGTHGDIVPEAQPVSIGSRVGAFTIESVLGEGGMATVYRAVQDEPRRAVALKLIRADHAADSTYRKRFLAEKDTLAALEHPSIVPIYAAGEADGHLFLAMRLVDGPDLAGRLAKDGRLSLDATVNTLRPIADAVDYAHEMGIVHRDLKPSNIILDRRGRPYLTDFGLGKHVDQPRDLSVPGAPVGTLAYMAPEQFSGTVQPSLAGRIDVYALGCVAYACLTGQPPFRADEPQTVMYGHLEGAIPDIRTARADLPTGVTTAIRRALAKDPASRYPTASAFLDALGVAAQVADDQTAPVPVPSGMRGSRISSWARANSMAAGALVTVAALVLAGTTALAISGGPRPSESGDSGATQGAVASPQRTNPGGGASPTSLSSPLVTLGPSLIAPPSPLVTTEPTGLPVPTPTPTVRPNRTPTPTRTPAPDTKAPTGGVATAIGNVKTDLTTKLAIKVRIDTAPKDASGICFRATTNTDTRPSVSSSKWVSYKGGTPTFDHTLASGSAGDRFVYVWFKDCSPAGNRSVDPAVAVIAYDHAPQVILGVNYNQVGAKCSGFTLGLLPYVATDQDGAETIDIVKVWRGTSTYGGGGMVDYTNFISSNGENVQVGPGSMNTTVTFYFVVEDHYEVQRQGSFTITVTCA